MLSCVDRVFKEYPELRVTEIVKQRLLSGALSRVTAKEGTYRAYSPNGEFVGVTEVFKGEKGNVLKIVKAFL